MKKFLSIALVLVMLATVLAGCGASQGQNAAAGGNTGENGTGGSTGEGGASGGVLRVVEVTVNKADPHTGVDLPATILMANLYDTLVFPNEEGGVDPWLAESWDISDDGMSYTFYLRQGVKFHDGSELTASDVVFSIERLIRLGEGFGYLFEGLYKGADIDGDYTVTLHLNNKFAPFVSSLTRLCIVNEELIMANADMSVDTYGEYGDYGKDYLLTHDAGSGPYTITEWAPSSYIDCDKFDDFWNGWSEDAPSGVKFVMVESTKQVVPVMTMLENREVEMSYPDISMEDAASMEAVEGVKAASTNDGCIQYLMYNTQKAPTDDIFFRMALNCLIDYDTATYDCFLNAERAESIVTMGLAGARAPKNVTYEYNLEKAKEYLAQSKYADQLDQYPVDFTYNNSVAANQKIALMLQAEAQKAGITVEITEVPWITLTELVADKESTPNITAIQAAASYWEAGSMLEARFSSATQGTWQNIEWLEDSTIDEMITKSVQTIDDAERFELYGEAIDYIAELYSCAPICETTSGSCYNQDYVFWPQAEQFFAGEAKALPMGYHYYFHDFEIYPDKM